MAGYHNYKMSNNAVMAYQQGEKPLSKWTKSALLYAVKEAGGDYVNAKKLTVAELRNEVLTYSSWHHTSCRYNTTDFYSPDNADELTSERISEIISSREPRENKKIKETGDPAYIGALVSYTAWEGTIRRPKPRHVEEVIFYREGEKLVKTSKGKKRLSSCKIIKSVSQKTKFPTEKKVKNSK